MDTPHAYIWLNTAVYSVLYTVLYTALYTEHSIASCQSASLTFLVSWRMLPPPFPSCFLYTIPTLHYALYWTIYSTLYCKLDFTLYCTLNVTLYSSLSFTPQYIQTPKWLADMTYSARNTSFPVFRTFCWTLYCTIYCTLYCRLYCIMPFKMCCKP